MQSHKILRWGNSLAVRLPMAFAKSARLAEGNRVTMTVKDRKIVIEPARDREPRLARLVKGITPDNRHQEIATGGPVGNEVW